MPPNERETENRDFNFSVFDRSSFVGRRFFTCMKCQRDDDGVCVCVCACVSDDENEIEKEIPTKSICHSAQKSRIE